MARPVICFDQIEKVGTVYRMLESTTHNGFPVLGTNGHLVGLILRKTLCSLLKLKAFSVPQAAKASGKSSKTSSANADTDNANPDDSTHFLTINNTCKDSYSAPTPVSSGEPQRKRRDSSQHTTTLAPSATVFYDTLERNYPRYPKIGDIDLTAAEKVSYEPSFV